MRSCLAKVAILPTNVRAFEQARRRQPAVARKACLRGRLRAHSHTIVARKSKSRDVSPPWRGNATAVAFAHAVGRVLRDWAITPPASAFPRPQPVVCEGRNVALASAFTDPRRANASRSWSFGRRLRANVCVIALNVAIPNPQRADVRPCWSSPRRIGRERARTRPRSCDSRCTAGWRRLVPGSYAAPRKATFQASPSPNLLESTVGRNQRSAGLERILAGPAAGEARNCWPHSPANAPKCAFSVISAAHQRHQTRIGS